MITVNFESEEALKKWMSHHTVILFKREKLRKYPLVYPFISQEAEKVVINGFVKELIKLSKTQNQTK